MSGPPPLPPKDAPAGTTAAAFSPRLSLLPVAPMPPSSRVGPAPPPLPPKKPDTTATQQRFLVVDAALKLRDEQLRAKIKYHNKDLRTNAELDAMTEQVVAELRAMALAERISLPQVDAQAIEIELISNLRGLLERLFGEQRAVFLQRRMELIQRKISQLFFHSELYARLAEEGKTVAAAEWSSQVLYFALAQCKDVIEVAIADIPTASPDLTQEALERFAAMQKALCSEFLAFTTPELERVLKVFQKTYADFFLHELPQELPELAWAVIKESRAADGHAMGYKITQDKFAAFRATFDKHLLERLLLGTMQRIEEGVEKGDARTRAATLLFVEDPEVHAAVCAVINDGIYEYLHAEGFLDLPDDWRSALKDD